MLVWGLAVSAAAADEVSGVVLELDGVTPVEGAIVTLQATAIRTTTDAAGHFILDVPSSTDLVIVAAKKGYFNESILATPPVTDAEFLLPPVLQENDPDYLFLYPGDCGGCHTDQFEEWTDSPMADAGLNTWVLDIYNGSGTAGGLGGFVYTRDSVYADSNPNSECASCHQPEVWIDSPGLPIQPSTRSNTACSVTRTSTGPH